jgi:hypothetical protein
MTPEERKIALEHLLNPQMPDPFICFDYGVPERDLPPRRTLWQRLRAQFWLPPKA